MKGIYEKMNCKLYIYIFKIHTVNIIKYIESVLLFVQLLNEFMYNLYICSLLTNKLIQNFKDDLQNFFNWEFVDWIWNYPSSGYICCTVGINIKQEVT